MNKNKRTFKILLDANRTDSYTGNQFNASYYVDLRNIIVNNEDFDKQYHMYCSFRSRGDHIVNNEISTNEVFLLDINLNKGINTYQYTQPYKNMSFILPVSVSNELSATPQTYFYLKEIDNMPVFINNIRSINFINLNVYKASTNTLFDPILDYNSYYVCILTFVEV